MTRPQARNLRLITAQARAFLNNEQLAKRAHVHPQTITNLRRCKVEPTHETAEAIARALGVRPNELFTPRAVVVEESR